MNHLTDRNMNRICGPSFAPKFNSEATENKMNFKKLFESMKCVDCSLIPSPFARFLCPDGHLHCAQCGDARYLDYEATCMAIVENGKKTEGESTDKEKQQKACASSDVSSPPVSTAVGKIGKCQKKIRRYPPDPIYLSLWLQAVWKCPNSLYSGCQATLKGVELFGHLSSEECIEPEDGDTSGDD